MIHFRLSWRFSLECLIPHSLAISRRVALTGMGFEIIGFAIEPLPCRLEHSNPTISYPCEKG
jgi:hypothetical protein